MNRDELTNELARVTAEIADLELRIEDLGLFGGRPAEIEAERRKLGELRTVAERIEANLRETNASAGLWGPRRLVAGNRSPCTRGRTTLRLPA